MPPELDSKDDKEDSEQDKAKSDSTSMQSNHSSGEIASIVKPEEDSVKKDAVEPKVSIEAFHDQKEIEGSDSELETIDTLQEKLKRELTIKRNQEEQGAKKMEAKKTKEEGNESNKKMKKKESSQDKGCCLIL